VKLYKVNFTKRIKGKKHALFHAANWRRNGELIEFLDESGNVLQRFSILQIRGEPFIFADGDDPLCAVSP